MQLAQAYRDGEGVERDYALALYWYSSVVDERGSPAAKYEIGELYRKGGPGLPKDPALALKWYSEAADEGMDWAQYQVGRGVS